MESTPHKDANGVNFEVLTFREQRQQVTIYSHEAHKINFICREYGLNQEKYHDFVKAKEILRTQKLALL